ncbi:MAG TPA: NAD(P)-dependent oxidoreductase [Candidatus Binatia bacterium]|nr:NAD(P)-dependent oxidoreductase [Candidatus Binatia bacterium]
MAIRAGFIGLGNIGKPMAQRLVQAGFETIVYDVRADARRELTELGARAAESCAAVAAASEVIGVCVRDDNDVRHVTLGPDGVIAHARPDAIIALHSTILPRTVQEIGRAADARGIGLIDAPMTGAAAGAQRGTLTYMVGGDPRLLERCRPVLAASAKQIVHCGELGSGAVTKLCNNLIGYMGFLAVFEAALLATQSGRSLDPLIEVTRSNGYLSDATASFVRFRQTVEQQRDDAALQTRVRNLTDLAEKDLAVTLAFAREQGVTLPGAAVCQQLMARVYGLRDDKRR